MRKEEVQKTDQYSFEKRKLICNISGNKSSKVKNELYSERRRVIEYFEKNHPDEFDLFGEAWKTKNYKTYRGICESKGETYSK